MRRLVIIAFVALIGLMPFTASAQTNTAHPSEVKTDYLYPLVLATGALVGVVGVNYWNFPYFTLPLTLAVPYSAVISSPAAAAASRIYVITSGVAGALIANWLYGK
ncbi:MAG: hypothetical protein WCK65_07295 [Rhodospirillaceae bacterium]